MGVIVSTILREFCKTSPLQRIWSFRISCELFENAVEFVHIEAAILETLSFGTLPP